LYLSCLSLGDALHSHVIFFGSALRTHVSASSAACSSGFTVVVLFGGYFFLVVGVVSSVFFSVVGVVSTVFFWASLADIWLALFAAGAMFAAMSIIGFTTNMDLSGMRSYLLMGLIGLIIASVINIFWASSTLYWIVTYAGVLLFVALTAYDTQWIKRAATEIEVSGMSSGEATVRRVAIIGALKLYLDFINLFLYILRIVSDR